MFSLFYRKTCLRLHTNVVTIGFFIMLLSSFVSAKTRCAHAHGNNRSFVRAVKVESIIIIIVIFFSCVYRVIWFIAASSVVCSEKGETEQKGAGSGKVLSLLVSRWKVEMTQLQGFVLIPDQL